MKTIFCQFDDKNMHDLRLFYIPYNNNSICKLLLLQQTVFVVKSSY